MHHQAALGQQIATTFVKVMEELSAESQRGAAVLAFAWMDDELTRTLKRLFIPSTQSAEKADELFGVGRPIGDAATKIDVAYRLSILPEATCRSLHIFRKLRNDFAHLSTSITFETDSVRDRLRTLFELQKDMTDAIRDSINRLPEVKALLQEHDGKPSFQALAEALGPRRLFHFLAATTVGVLIMATHNMPSMKTLISLYNASEA
jgi:hypothetical protein